MYLFGGKFCKFLDESGLERECTCPEIISRHPQCECDRKHFNNILWATVTVFQVRTIIQQYTTYPQSCSPKTPPPSKAEPTTPQPQKKPTLNNSYKNTHQYKSEILVIMIKYLTNSYV